MSLSDAALSDGTPVAPGPVGPFECESLRPLMEVAFRLPCGDPWLQTRGTPAHTYLEAAGQAWRDHPEWMDFLDQQSPAWDIKRAARDVYLHWLEPFVKPGQEVLDVGCGIGRITQSLLDLGLTVYGADGDLQSLQRCAWHAAGRAGKLDLFWTTPDHLPDVQVDLAVSVEVLCYLEDPAAGLAAMVDRVRPGGRVFLTMEARWGWAASPDAPADGVDVALGEGNLLHLEGDRYVHLQDRESMVALLEGAGLEVELLEPTHYLTDGPLEDLLPSDLTQEVLIGLEAKFRAHPVWGPLNRIWTAVGRKPHSA